MTPQLSKIASQAGGRCLPDADGFLDRMLIPNADGSRSYIIERSAETGMFRCGCPGFTRHGHCKHYDAMAPALARIEFHGAKTLMLSGSVDVEVSRGLDWSAIVAGEKSLGVAGDARLWSAMAESLAARLGRLDFKSACSGKLAEVLDIFGFSSVPSLADLKKARARLLLAEGIHPDKGGTAAEAAKVIEAYQFLKRQIH